MTEYNFVSEVPQEQQESLQKKSQKDGPHTHAYNVVKKYDSTGKTVHACWIVNEESVHCEDYDEKEDIKGSVTKLGNKYVGRTYFKLSPLVSKPSLVCSYSLKYYNCEEKIQFCNVHGEYVTYSNDKIVSHSNFVDGEEEGLSRQFYQNGNIHSTRFYVRGRLEGIAKHFYTDGKIHSECKYVKGVKHGMEIVWRENTQIYKSREWNNGVYVARSGKEWDTLENTLSNKNKSTWFKWSPY